MTENVKSTRTGKPCEKVASPKEKVLRIFACGQTFSLISSNVGYHFDAFQDVPSLENKKCLTWGNHDYVGRGGAGPNKFAFALLDWKGSKVDERRQEHFSVTGKPPTMAQQVTEEMHAECFGHHSDKHLSGAENS